MTQQSNNNQTRYSQFCSWLYEPIDCSTLILFRLLYAGLIFIYAIPFWMKPGEYIKEWDFIPTYSFLRFMENWPALDLSIALTFVCVGSLGLFSGFCYRLSAIVFFLAYTSVYVFIPVIYNNHYYLISLLAFWWIFINGDAQLSLDSLWRSNLPKKTIPRWHLLVMQLHISMVYFFGGVAKINSDWLQGEPMRYWLKNQHDFPILGPLLLHEHAGLAIAWLGLIFDLVIPFLLIYKPTRVLAICLTFMFHLMNTRLFHIGIFPYMMLGTNILYLEPETPRRWWFWLRGIKTDAAPDIAQTPKTRAVTPRQKAIVAALGCYFLLHCFMPFRHHFYRGHVEWTEEAKNFSWRMMLSNKQIDFFAVHVIDVDGRQWVVNHAQEKYLSEVQHRSYSTMGNPRHMACFARFIKQEAIRKKGMTNPRVHVLSICSLNGRPHQFLVNPFVDLATAEVPVFSTPEWVVPLQPDQPIGNYIMTEKAKKERIDPLFNWYLRKMAAASPANPRQAISVSQ